MIINTNYLVNNTCGNIVILEHATLHAYVTILHSALISVTPILLGNFTGITVYTNVLYCSKQFKEFSFVGKGCRSISICFYMETRKFRFKQKKCKIFEINVCLNTRLNFILKLLQNINNLFTCKLETFLQILRTNNILHVSFIMYYHPRVRLHT